MQGFNMGRYVPPDLEGTISGNKLAGKHALGKRASKLSSQGILTVRFEMPYAIWCTTCPKPTIIGQGVRFNAEKKKVGNYHTTPIYSFRMKHVDCGGWIEIRTDPKNTAYVVTEGARKRDTGEDVLRDGDVEILTPEEREKLRADAFASLEGRNADKQRLIDSTKRIEEIYALQDKQWEDPYTRSQQLRRTFRAERKELEKDAAAMERLQDTMGLGVQLLPASEEDAQRASFVDFGADDFSEQPAIDKTVAKPLFKLDAEQTAAKLRSGRRLSRRQQEAELVAKRKANLVSEIRGNTRAATDPFLLANRAEARTPVVLQGLKRKRKNEESEEKNPNTVAAIKPAEEPGHDVQASTKGLVDYESD